MARISSPLLGSASGIVAGLELYRSNYTNYVRSKKLKRYKNKTSEQNEREQLFRQLVLAYSAMNSYLKQFWKPKRFRLTFANYFLAQNYKYYHYNPSLNNIGAVDIPLFRFFPSTLPVNLQVSEFEHVPFVGFRATYLSDFDFSPYSLYGIAVSLGGRIFEPLDSVVDVFTKTITLQTGFPLVNGHDAYVFLFITSQVGDLARVIYSCFANMAISPK